tara:strand:+ start:200 stop:388 length:189 start_codon:yes stop_codon:yes gene_type:complete
MEILILFSLILALATGGAVGLAFAISKIWRIPSMWAFTIAQILLCLLCTVVAIACVFQITYL